MLQGAGTVTPHGGRIKNLKLMEMIRSYSMKLWSVYCVRSFYLGLLSITLAVYNLVIVVKTIGEGSETASGFNNLTALKSVIVADGVLNALMFLVNCFLMFISADCVWAEYSYSVPKVFSAGVANGTSYLYLTLSSFQFLFLCVMVVLLMVSDCRYVAPSLYGLTVIYVALSAVVLVFYALSVITYNVWRYANWNSNAALIRAHNPVGTSEEYLLSNSAVSDIDQIQESPSAIQ